MTVMFHLWRKAAEERNSLEMVRRQLVHDLAVAQAQAAAPCRSCEQLEADLLDVMDDRDRWRDAAQFLERIGLSGEAAQ